MALKKTAMGLFGCLPLAGQTNQSRCVGMRWGHRLDWYRSEGKAILRVTVAAEATGNL